jgi:hypothetical protein
MSFRQRNFVDRARQTPEYRALVAAVRRLAVAEGLDTASRAYAEATYDLKEQSYAASRKVRRSQGHPCIRRLLGKRCDGWNRPDGIACESPVSDHDTLWIKDGKPEVFLAQPYGMGLDAMRNLVRLCDAHSLYANVDAWPSFHFPGHVLSVEIKRRSPSDPPARGASP